MTKFIICAEKKMFVVWFLPTFKVFKSLFPILFSPETLNMYKHVGMLMENFAIFVTLIFILTIHQALGKKQRTMTFL
jgi:hypothetical protein